jgi:hypothetical protein
MRATSVLRVTSRHCPRITSCSMLAHTALTGAAPGRGQVEVGDDLVHQRAHEVPREDGRAGAEVRVAVVLREGDVHGRGAAADGVVVHPVVVHEEVGLESSMAAPRSVAASREGARPGALHGGEEHRGRRRLPPRRVRSRAASNIGSASGASPAVTARASSSSASMRASTRPRTADKNPWTVASSVTAARMDDGTDGLSRRRAALGIRIAPWMIHPPPGVRWSRRCPLPRGRERVCTPGLRGTVCALARSLSP